MLDLLQAGFLQALRTDRGTEAWRERADLSQEGSKLDLCSCYKWVCCFAGAEQQHEGGETSYLLGSSQSSFGELAVAVLSIGADGHP